MKLKGHVKAVSQRNRNNRCCAVYSVTNSRGFTPSTDYFSKEIYSKDLSTYKLVEKGMIAYNPSRINVGSVALQDKAECVIVSPLYVVFCVDETLLCPEYVTYFLKSEPGLRQIDFRSIGTVRNNFTFDALEKMELRVPSVGDQLHVVSIIRRVESVIESTKQKSNQLDDLVKSRFVEMFGDCHCEKMSIGDLVYEMHIGPFGSAMKSDAFVSEEEAACVVYEQKHAIKQSIDLGWRYVDAAKKSELKRFAAGPGTILVSCRGTIGKVFQLPDNAPIGIIHPSVMKIEIDESKLNGVFFSFLLEKLFAEAETRAVGSGVKMAIKAKDLASTEIEYPPIQLQQEFAAFVAQVDKLRFEACYAMYLLCAAFTLL